MPSIRIEVKLRETITRLALEPYTVVGKDEDGRDKYGYPPKREKEETAETEIYSQVIYADTTVALEKVLQDVIKAANGI